jgi:hypothetical protein
MPGGLLQDAVDCHSTNAEEHMNWLRSWFVTVSFDGKRIVLGVWDGK